MKIDRDDIVRMAQEAGVNVGSMAIEQLESFACLVAASVREACAKHLISTAERLAPEGKRTNQIDRHTADLLRDEANNLLR